MRCALVGIIYNLREYRSGFDIGDYVMGLDLSVVALYAIAHNVYSGNVP